MILSNRILIIVAAVPVIIAIVLAAPRISPGAEQPSLVPISTSSEVSVQFIMENMRRVSFGVTENIGAEKREILAIGSDGSALYNLDVEGEKREQAKFRVGLEDWKRIKALITETGFLQLPVEQFELNDDATEFTRYTLTVTVDSQTKRVQWFDEAASKDFVPPLVLKIGELLLEAMKGRA